MSKETRNLILFFLAAFAVTWTPSMQKAVVPAVCNWARINGDD